MLRRFAQFSSVILLLAAALLLRPSHGLADDHDTTAAVTGWSRPIYYDPPHETKLKYRLSGDNATALPNSRGSVRIVGAQVKQFSLAGDTQMTAQAPDCIFAPRDNTLSSTNRLTVHAQENRLFLEGIGFILFQTNSTLLISNATHAILRNLDTNGGLTTTEIFSTSAEFRMKSEDANGVAIFRRAVRVHDPRMDLASELLTVDLPREGADSRVSHIVAETNVLINFLTDHGDRLLAHSEKAVYHSDVVNGVTNQTLALTGHPRVDLTNGWMTADLLTLNRANGHLTGQTNFHLHYFGQAPTNAASQSTNQPEPADIYSDRFDYDLNTRIALFNGRVRVDDPRLKLTSAALTATLPESSSANSNHIDNIFAETNVVVDFSNQGTNQTIRATGQKAEYHNRVSYGVTNETLTLKGNPAVEVSKPDGWMTAEVITMDRAQGHIQGVGNHHSVLKKKAGEPAYLDTEIFSDRFDFSQDTGIANYDGNVRDYDPEINLASRTLTLKFFLVPSGPVIPGQSNHLETATAEGKVVIDFIDKPFYVGDITNLTAFSRRLQRTKASDNIAKYLQSKLSPPTIQAMMHYEKGPDDRLQNAYIDDLNRWVTGSLLYTPDRFSGIYLSLETTALLNQSPAGMQLQVANRLLLLDAFRDQLKRDPKGEPTHATGDRAIYTYKNGMSTTNGVLELIGHPVLDKGTLHLTADQAIISDRNSGTSHTVGGGHLHTTLENLPASKSSDALKKKSK